MSDINMSLINLDGASDVLIKFLEMIEKAVGWAVSPHGSKIDFNEAVILYKNSIENDKEIPVEIKAARISAARKDLKQYINKGKIIAYTIPDLKQDANLNIEEDWLTYFFNYAENVSDESIQKIWAKILAEQCNGDTSIKRTLIHTLSLIDSNSAKAFGNLCKLTFEYPQMDIYKRLGNKFTSRYIPLVISPQLYGLYLAMPKETEEYRFAKEYAECIPSPEEIAILQEIGLIDLPEKRGDEFEYPYNFGLVQHDYSGKNNSYKGTIINDYVINYDNKEYIIDSDAFISENANIEIENVLPETINYGMIKFTTIGETLYKIINIEKIKGFVSILEMYLNTQQFSIRKGD